MKICIIEDEIAQAKYLESLVHHYDPTINVRIYTSGEAFLFENMTYPYDLLFLDIQLDKLSGIEVATTIRQTDTTLPIVFLTNDASYVFEGYKVNALRYLLKPIDENELKQILSSIKPKESKSIILKIDKEEVKMNLDDIYSIESEGHNLHIYTNQEYITRMNLSAIEKELDQYFISIYRGIIVNIKYVKKVSKESCVLTNEKSYPVSKLNYNKLNQLFIQYNLGEL